MAARSFFIIIVTSLFSSGVRNPTGDWLELSTS
jgi:hypothetical protein